MQVVHKAVFIQVDVYGFRTGQPARLSEDKRSERAHSERYCPLPYSPSQPVSVSSFPFLIPLLAHIMPAIFSKISSKTTKTAGRLSAIAAKAKAKLGPRLPRGDAVIPAAKLAIMAASKLGGAVPYLQGIADVMDQIVASPLESRILPSRPR